MDTITFPNRWITSKLFEQTLRNNPELLTASTALVRFEFPKECKIMVSAGVKILSLANQLQFSNKQVTLSFDPESSTFGYLDRMGFFKHLNPEIWVKPEKPSVSSVDIYRGNNSGLVEFESINPNYRNDSIPRRLEQALTSAVSKVSDDIDCESLGHSAFTVFGELISNIYEHSETELDGYAVSQVYRNGGQAIVAVSDSGKGLLETLKPGLKKYSLSFTRLSDEELLIEAFRNGLSRHGKIRGDGLKQCAVNAIRYNAELEIRLPTCYVRLVPSADGYTPHKAYTHSDVPLLWGTHIAFNFSLD